MADYRSARSTHILTSHLAGGANHGTRLLTSADGDSLAQNVPLLYDANGNVISTATRSGDTTQFVTHDAGSKTIGNVPIYDGNGNLTDSGVTPGGGGGGAASTIIDGLALPFDPAPVSPNTEDDEFAATALDSKWTVITNTASIVDFNTTWASHLYVKFTGNNSYTISQSYAPSGNFTMTAKYRNDPQVNFINAAIQLLDNDASDGVMIRWYSSSGGVRVALDIRNSNSWAFDQAFILIPYSNTLIIHIERETNNWIGFASYDGLSFFRVGQVAKTVTIDQVLLSTGGGGGSVAKWATGCDWIRRDWLTI